jgi:hypothetical protein
VIELLRNSDLRRRLSAAARKQVENAHAWPNSMAILDGILENGQDSRKMFTQEILSTAG